MIDLYLRQLISTEYGEILTKYDSAINDIKNQLRIIPMYFRHYSKHDASHSEQILENLERLLGKEGIELLSASDLLMLLLACYSHDLGLSLTNEEITAMLQSEKWISYLKKAGLSNDLETQSIAKKLLEYPECTEADSAPDIQGLYDALVFAIENCFREDHASRSAKKIRENYLINNLLNKRCIGILADICKSHEDNIESIMSLSYEENGLFGDYFHPRFIAGLLCLGDLTDLDCDRFDEVVLKASSKMPHISMIHKLKHESVKSYLIKNYGISLVADCPNVDVYIAMHQWTEYMHKASEFMILNWGDITPASLILPPRIVKCEILINGNSKWNSFVDDKIKIDADRAIELLSGSGVYRGKQTFIREIIQNAVDASLIQMCRDLSLNLADGEKLEIQKLLYEIKADRESMPSKIHLSDYEINGRIFIDNEEVIFELTDHGTGISSDEIAHIAGITGKSQKLKDEIKKYPQFLRPSGAFGIGLQSVFQVAKKVEFFTKTDAEAPKKITMLNPRESGLVYVEEYLSDMKRGTRVRITLDNDRITQTDLGRSDYEYNTRDKKGLVLGWLLQSCINIQSADMPYFERKKQKSDYFDVCIRGHFVDETDDFDALKFESIFKADLKENYKQEQNILSKINECDYSDNVEFDIWDFDNNCRFVGQLQTGGKDATVFGSIDERYMHQFNGAVWYRNAYVCDEILRDILKEQDRIFEYLDFAIYLYSDGADEILNLGRNNIRNEYISKMENLILCETSLLKKKIVENCLSCSDDDKIGNGLVLLAYIYSFEISGEKTQKIKEKYKNRLEQFKINGYIKINDEDEEWPVLNAEDMTLNFAREITDQDGFIYDSVLEKLSKASETPENLLHWKYNKDCGRHFLNHYLVGEKFVAIDDKKHKIYSVTTNKKSVKYAPEIDDFILYQEFLIVIFNHLRCMRVSRGFECLATPLSNGVIERYSHRNDVAIEVQIDSEIKSQLENKLSSKGLVENAVDDWLEKIVASKVYKDNVDFIVSYHRHHNDGVSRKIVEEKYKEYYRFLLGLLERSEYADFCKANLDILKNKELQFFRLGERFQNQYARYMVLTLNQRSIEENQ